MTKSTVDRIVGLSALIISLLTLIMFFYQTREIHRQSRLSVLPILDFNVLHELANSTETLTVELANRGIGPAIIHKAEIVNEQETHELALDTYMEKKYPLIENLGNFNQSTSITKETPLSPDHSIVLFTFAYPSANRDSIIRYLDIDEMFRFPFNIEVSYSSVYEEHWNIALYD